MDEECTALNNTIQDMSASSMSSLKLQQFKNVKTHPPGRYLSFGYITNTLPWCRGLNTFPGAHVLWS